MNDKIKVLMLAPAPFDIVYLRLDEEVLEIEHKLGISPFGDLFDLIPRSGIRVHDIRMLLLRHRPHIFHFSGHSRQSEEILLVDFDGYSRPVGVQKLTAILRVFKDDIRIVLLNVCYSKSYAEAISQEIAFVIGMDGTIREEEAIIFASSFYQALASRRSVKEAFEIAKILSESSAPVLLIRQGVKNSEPFFSRLEYKAHIESMKSVQERFKVYIESLKPIQECLIAAMEVELLREAMQKTAGQGEELWRWQSEDGRFIAYAVLEPNADLTLHFSTSDQQLEGARLDIKLGELNREATLQQVSESESHAEIVIKRRERPRRLNDISIEIA